MLYMRICKYSIFQKIKLKNIYTSEYFSDKTTCAFLCLKKQNECHAYRINYKYESNKENCMLYKFPNKEDTKCIGRYILKLILQKITNTYYLFIKFNFKMMYALKKQ